MPPFALAKFAHFAHFARSHFRTFARGRSQFPLASIVILSISLVALSTPAAFAQREAAAATPEGLIEGFEPLETEPGPLAEFETQWSRVRGVNYIPSYAASPYECWINYDDATVRRELAAAARLGFNSVRVWLSYNAYEEKPTPTIDAIHEFLNACEDSGLTALPILFDARGVDPSDHIAGRESMQRAYERFLSRKEVYGVRPGFERFAKITAERLLPEREVPSCKNPAVMLWGDWAPSPGHKRMGKEHWPRYVEYLKAVIEPLRDDKVVIAWDVMNELGSQNPLANRPDRDGEREFADAMVDAVKLLRPSQPITIGFSGGYPGSSILGRKLDVISAHLPQRAPRQLIAELAEVKRLTRDKPVLLCEGGGVLFPIHEREASDVHQEEFVRGTVVALERERVGFYLWQLVEGKAMTPWTGLIKSDGTVKPAGEWVRRRFGK